MQQPGKEGYLRSGGKLVQFLVLLRKEDRLDLVQPTTDPRQNLVLNLIFDPGRRIASTEWLEGQSEQPEDISRSSYDIGRPRFPQDRRTEAEDSHNVLYAVVKELVREISSNRMGRKKQGTLPATSAPAHCTMVATKLASSRVKE